MARVSQAHLDARRRQILDGARHCFVRNGFHATSMQDILEASGLSAGAVYRYFSSKDEIIAAIAGEVLDTVRAAHAAIAETSPPPMPWVLMGAVLDRIRSTLGDAGDPRELSKLLVQVWAESLRNPTLAAVLTEGYNALRGQWVRHFEMYQKRGLVDPGVSAEHLAHTLIGAVQGHFLQGALFGSVNDAGFRQGLRALLSMGSEQAS